MKGKILDYNIKQSKGVILADNGNRYNFTNQEWQSYSKAPKVNQNVDFVIENENIKEIYCLSSFEPTTIKYPFGFFITIFLIGSLFLPIAKIPFEGTVTTYSYIQGTEYLIGLGILLPISLILFYSGTFIVLRAIIGLIITGILGYIFYILFNNFADLNNLTQNVFSFDFFKLLEYGVYIVIPLVVLFFVASF